MEYVILKYILINVPGYKLTNKLMNTTSFITTSIFDLFKIGPGPSSSHTIGPMNAALDFLNSIHSLDVKKTKSATSIEVHLFGSLSATGKGHGTDRAITAGLLCFLPKTCDINALKNLLQREDDCYFIKIKNRSIPFGIKNIHFDSVTHSFPYNNTMIFKLLNKKDVIIEKEYYSIGGGFIRYKDEVEEKRIKPPYAYSNAQELTEILKSNNLKLSDLILANESFTTGRNHGHIMEKLHERLIVMEKSVNRGIYAQGLLPGPIKLERKANVLYKKMYPLENSPKRFLALLNAYALAVSEENAAGHRVVTAPTSGAAGVIPAILYMLKYHFNKPKHMLCEGLIAAAAIGFIIKHNASISGAEVGCQGEVGVASSMGAALLAYVDGFSIEVVLNAAEIALEHHLGLTCDPIGGYVQIPCIERNAVAAVTAYNAYLLASIGDPRKQKLKLDQVVDVMLKTGQDMSSKYKETSEGGLAMCTITC